MAAGKEDVTRVLIETLRQDAAIQSLLAWTTQAGQYKIFGGDVVDEAVPHPYITIQYFTGGYDYKAMGGVPADMLLLVKVEGEIEGNDLTANTKLNVVRQIGEAIHDALHLQYPVLPASMVGRFATNQKIKEQFPYEDKQQRQNRHYPQRGGVYRVVLEEV